MRQLLTALLVFTSTNLWSDEQWKTIAPLDNCEKFQIKYRSAGNGKYRVLIPSSDGMAPVEEQLDDINDLSSITDILTKESVSFCPPNGPVLKVDNLAIYFEEGFAKQKRECSTPIKYSAPYVDLTKELVEILQHKGNRCDQLMAYTELQTKIAQLSDQDLIKLERPNNLVHKFFQVVAGDDVDELINLYHTCGGKRFTDKFVANLILIEAKNACVMPKPPGMFSFKQVKEIAEDVSKKYANLSLMDLNSKKGEITRKAVLALTMNGLKGEIKPLLGPSLNDLDGFISGLDSVKELKSMDFSDLDPDYLGLGFAFEATLEVARKAIPVIARSSFADKLPQSWSEKKSEEFLNKILIPKVQGEYEWCMSGHHRGSGFGAGLSTSGKLKLRKKLKKQYCKDHPEQCAGNSCNESINLLSGDPEIKDSQVAQGCVMAAMLKAIKPLTKLGIADQKDTFKDKFDLSANDVDKLTEEGWLNLVQCANRQASKKANIKVSSFEDPDKAPIFTSPELLQRISSKDFESIVLDCANVVEIGVAKEFFTKTLTNTDALKNLYSNKDASPVENDKKLRQSVDKIISETYDPCIYRQNLMSALPGSKNTATRNPLLCVPSVEIAAAKKVVGTTLQGLYQEIGIENSPEAILSLKGFDNCAQSAQTNALDAVDDSSARTPITNDAEANSYLEKNHELYGCVRAAILDTTSVAGSKMFDDAITDLAKDLQDAEYVKGLKAGALNATTQCFERDLAKIGNWKEFNEYNDAGGIDKTQEKCSAVAIDYVLPKTLIHESALQLASLQKEKLVSDDAQIDQVLERAAEKLRKDYDLALPKGLNSNAALEWTFAHAHNQHIKNGGETASFVGHFTEKVTEIAVNTIHTNITEALTHKSGKTYDDFFEALTPQCLIKVKERFAPQIEELSQTLADAPKKEEQKSEPAMDMVIQALAQGLRYQEGLGERAYKAKLAQIKNACARVDKARSPEVLSGVADFILKGFIQDSVVKSFQSVAKVQCEDDLRNILVNPDSLEAIQQACSATDLMEVIQGFNEVLTQEMVSQKPDIERAIYFIQQRHIDMTKLIKNKIEDSAQFDQLIFAGDGSVLDFVNDNFADLALQKQSSVDKVSAIIGRKLFESKELGGFADEFTRLQITSGIGINGYQQAKDSITPEAIDKAVGKLDFIVNKDKVLKASLEGLAHKWRPGTIKRLIAWDKIEAKEREKLVSGLYDFAVSPSLVSEDIKADEIAEMVGSHLADYKYQSLEGTTFSDRMASEVEAYLGKDGNKTQFLGFEDKE